MTVVNPGGGGGGTPSGPAGGELAGTYPNPTIAEDSIDNADVKAAAGIVKSKLAALGITNADMAAGAAAANLGAAGGDLSGTYPNPVVAQALNGLEVPATANEALELAQVAANIVLANFLLATDANPAFEILGDGTIQWGAGGTAAPDMTLKRVAAGQLQAATNFLFGTSAGNAFLQALSGELRLYSPVGNLQVQLGDNLMQVNTALALAAVGKGLLLKEGTNGCMGIATLVGGTVTIANTSITANTRVFLTDRSAGAANLGTIAENFGARVAGTSFRVDSSNVLDTSTFSWLLIEPA